MGKTLLIIRHGRSQSNVRLSSDPDCALTEFGEKQALNVGNFLHNHVRFSRDWNIYTSPFLRCLQTSEKVNEPRRERQERLNISSKQKIIVMNGLREYINHAHTEVALTVGMELYPHFRWSEVPSPNSVRCEQNEEFLERMNSAYEKLPDKCIVITHGLPALMLARIAIGRGDTVPPWDHSLDNGSLTYVKQDRSVWWGRNLFHELDYDAFETRRSSDAGDGLTPLLTSSTE
jgi:broad specificity phosphatase PhoE